MVAKVHLSKYTRIMQFKPFERRLLDDKLSRCDYDKITDLL